MRTLLLVFLFPTLTLAQNPSWEFLEGPSYAPPAKTESIVHDRSSAFADEAGRALTRTADGLVALSLDGETWIPYAEALPVAANAEYLVYAGNLFSSGSGQDVIHDYSYSVEVVARSGHTTASISGFEEGAWAEHAAIGLETIWIGLQGYEGYGDNESVPTGTPTAPAIASVSYADIEAGAEGWTSLTLLEGDVLYDLVWTAAGVLAGTDDGLFAPTGERIAFSETSVYSIAETASGLLLAAVGDRAVYRSADGGNIWEEASPLPARVNDLFITSHAVLAAVEGHGVYRSEDEGTTWTLTGMTTSAESIAGLPDGPYYATGDGATLYRSEDGSTWTPKFFTEDAVEALTTTPQGLVAQTDNKLFRLEAGAWTDIFSLGRSFGGLSILAVAPDGTYYLTRYTGPDRFPPHDDTGLLYISQDEGVSWTSAARLSGNPGAFLVTEAETLLLELNARVARSEDGGKTWTPVLKNLGISALRQAEAGTIHAVTHDRFYSSADDGLSWTEHVFPPANLRDLIEQEDGTLVAFSSDGIYRAPGSDGPWALVLPSYSGGALAVNAVGDLFAEAAACSDSTGGALCRSTDGGATWQTFGADAPFDGVEALAVDTEGILYVESTAKVLGESGIYRTLETTVGSEDRVDPLASAVAYPNPVTGRTSLRFSTAQTGRVSVTVYDALGRVVRTLRDADLPAGSHRVPWDATGVAGGTYFARIVTPRATQTLSLTVVH